MQHDAGARFNRLRNIRAPHGYVVKAMAMCTAFVLALTPSEIAFPCLALLALLTLNHKP